MKYLVTGAAGFIGMYVAKRLLEEGIKKFVTWYKEFKKDI